MIVVEILLAIMFAKYGGRLTLGEHTAERVVGWSFLLIGLGLAGVAGSAAKAGPPVVISPVVLPPLQGWQPAPLTDDGYAMAKASCSTWSGRALVQGEVVKMVPHGGVWTADDRSVHSVWPLNAIGVRFAAIYPYADCLAGVKPL